MARHACLLLASILMLIFNADPSGGALVIDRCPIRVPEKAASFNVTCSGLQPAQDVTWTFYNLNYSSLDLGTCDITGHCSSNLPDFTYVTRPRGDVTVLTFRDVKRTNYGLISCRVSRSYLPEGNVSCSLDIVYEAEVSSCSTYANLTATGWEVHGRCQVDKVHSALGAYSCSLLQRLTLTSQEQTVATVDFNTTLYNATVMEKGSNSTRSFGRGLCSLSVLLNNQTGVPATYTVQVHPGATTDRNSSYTMALASRPPAAACFPSNGSYVIRRDNVTCTCVAPDLGQPQGQLRGYGDSFSASGDYGASELEIPAVSFRADDVAGHVTCEVTYNWTTATVRSRTTFLIAQAPESVLLTVGDIDSMRLESVTVNETRNTSLTVVCSAYGVPSPDLTLLKEGKAVANVTNVVHLASGNRNVTVLTYLVSATRESSGTYVCLAENLVGLHRKNVSLHIQFPPSEVPGESQTPIELNPAKDVVSFSVEVTAYPPPTTHAFRRRPSDVDGQTPSSSTQQNTTTTTSVSSPTTVSRSAVASTSSPSGTDTWDRNSSTQPR